MAEDDAFDLLADETRAAILQALAAAHRNNPRDRAVSFSELRERVGARDSGRFNYHLGKLRGRFVEKRDDGYRLSPVGHRAAASILAGAYDNPPERGPGEIEDDCGRCGEPLSAFYEDGLFVVTCENDHGFGDSLPPAALEDRSLREAVCVLDAQMRTDVRAVRRGTCPTCHGSVAWSFETDVDSAAPIEYAYVVVCQRCGQQWAVTAGLLVFDHPAVVSAYRDAGVDVREELLWTLDCCLPGVANVVSEDPVRVAVDAGPNAGLRFVVDETGVVVEEP